MGYSVGRLDREREVLRMFGGLMPAMRSWLISIVLANIWQHLLFRVFGSAGAQ
jgi:hypothetical protein